MAVQFFPNLPKVPYLAVFRREELAVQETAFRKAFHNNFFEPRRETKRAEGNPGDFLVPKLRCDPFNKGGVLLPPARKGQKGIEMKTDRIAAISDGARRRESLFKGCRLVFLGIDKLLRIE